MGKLPYVHQCELFVRCDFKVAEELLAEYHDFYIYNLAQYGHIYEKSEYNTSDDKDDRDEAKLRELAEHNARVATEHFTALFGSKDFAESAMVGFRPEWYDLQQILLEEFKQKTPIKDSAMNYIAPRLRNAASLMLYAERMVSGLEKAGATFDFIAPVKEGFVLLFENCGKQELNLPEYCKNKTAIAKFKKPEQYLEFCDKNLASQEPCSLRDKLFFGGK